MYIWLHNERRLIIVSPLISISAAASGREGYLATYTCQADAALSPEAVRPALLFFFMEIACSPDSGVQPSLLAATLSALPKCFPS